MADNIFCSYNKSTIKNHKRLESEYVGVRSDIQNCIGIKTMAEMIQYLKKYPNYTVIIHNWNDPYPEMEVDKFSRIILSYYFDPLRISSKDIDVNECIVYTGFVTKTKNYYDSSRKFGSVRVEKCGFID